MKLNAKSKSPRANAYLALGLDSLLRFREQPDNPTVLIEAERDLAKALEEDPAFLPAIYYRGVVRQLQGDSDLAISDLTDVLESRSPFKNEARFNLAVARYHRYGRVDLEEAESEFDTLLQSKAITKRLRLQTLVSLAQVYGQLMLQNIPEQPNLEDIHENFRRALEVETELRFGPYAEKAREQKLDSGIQWRIEDALGLAYMFASDYCSSLTARDGSEIGRATILRQAREHIEKADKLSPNNWAILCNLGSIWMRFAYWISKRARKETSQESAAPSEKSLAVSAGERKIDQSAQESAKQAEHYLRRVIDKVKPNYGFALYELGRLHRIEGDFPGALEWFERSTAVPEGKRDVSQGTLDREIQRARQESTVFP
jgi:tetratricopeptide (TPR) repeat protein